MSWLALIHGFTGIGYYNYLIDYWAMDMNPLFWEGLRAVNQEIKLLSEIILEGRDITSPAGAGGTALSGRIHYQIREFGRDRYIFAANTSSEKVRWELPLPPGPVNRRYSVVSENRSVTDRRGILTDSFEPFAVHLYKTGAPLANPATSRMLKDDLFIKAPARVHRTGNLASQFSGAKTSSSFSHMNVNHSMFATDDDPLTCWAPSTYFQPGHRSRKPSDWLQVEFPKAERIGKIIIRSYRPKYQPDPVQVLSDYTLEYWNGSAWANLASAQNDRKEIKEHRFAVVETCKVRLTVTKGLYVGEFEVY